MILLRCWTQHEFGVFTCRTFGDRGAAQGVIGAIQKNKNRIQHSSASNPCFEEGGQDHWFLLHWISNSPFTDGPRVLHQEGLPLDVVNPGISNVGEQNTQVPDFM